MTNIPALRLDGIAKIYGRTVALRALSLQLEPGQILALLGPNGSGKTTLLKIIAGAIEPTVGEGLVQGRDMRKERRRLRSDIGLMGDADYLYEDLSALENLRFLATMSARQRSRSELEAALEAVGLGQAAASRVRTFSAGMKRRLALARIEVLRPRLLLMDEPYKSLDADGAELVDTVAREVAVEGRTAVLATHEEERALKLATTVATLDNGRLTYFGSAPAYSLEAAKHVG